MLKEAHCSFQSRSKPRVLSFSISGTQKPVLYSFSSLARRSSIKNSRLLGGRPVRRCDFNPSISTSCRLRYLSQPKQIAPARLEGSNMTPLNKKVHHFRINGSRSFLCWLLEKCYPMHFDHSEYDRVKPWGAASIVQWILSAFALAEAILPNLSALAVARRSRCESLLFSWRLLFFPLFFVIFFSTDESPFGIFEDRIWLGYRCERLAREEYG